MVSGQHDSGDDGSRRDYQNKLSSLFRRKQQRVRHYWQQSEQDFGQISAISVGDVTSDLEDEIIIGTEDGQVLAINVASKHIIWQFFLGKAIRMTQTGPKDPGGYHTTLLCTGDEQIYVLDESGTIVAEQGQTFPGEHIISIFMSRQDKQPFGGIHEILLGSREKNIYVYDADLQKRHTTINVPDSVNVLSSHDLTAKNSSDILAGTLGGHVYAYQRRGQSADELWCYQTGACVRALAVKDLDEDGSVEVIVGSDDGNVYVLNAQGQLKWRYYTLVPVLAICILDIDHDGKVEILLGGANGTLYALNSEGDVRWTTEMHKPIRDICARDIDNDAVVEIALNVGGQLNLLQVIGMQESQDLQKELQHCIEEMNRTGNAQTIIFELANSTDETVRISALEALGDHSKYTIESMHQLEHLLQAVADSPQQEVRLSLANLLHRFVTLNAPLCFGYIKLFTSDPNLWIRRAAIRQLDRLVVLYPTDVFHILRERIASEDEWICLESSRVLAHYFDIHRDNLIDETSDLLQIPVKPLTTQQIATSSVQSSIRGFFTVLTDLLSYHYSEHHKGLLVQLLLARTLTDLETTQSVHAFTQNEGILYSPHMIRILNRLSTILNNLLTSKKAGISHDYAASLHTAIITLEDLERELQTDNIRLSNVRGGFQETLVAANMLLALLIHCEHNIIKTELHGLEGQARIIPEFRIKLLQHGEQCEVSVRISNAGNREARNVRMVLELDDDRFEIVGSNEQYLGTGSPQIPLLGRFTIVVKPQVDKLRLSFMIIYDDMNWPNRKIIFSEQVMSQKTFKEIANPYSSSDPVRDKQMFFDRTESLQFLREVLLSADTKIVLLYGQRRSGKTSLIYQMVNELNALGGCVPIFLDLQGLPIECTGPDIILASLTKDILDTLKERGLTVFSSYDVQADLLYAFESFLRQLVVELSERKLVLFIDEFDRLEEFVKDTTLSLLFVRTLIALMKQIDGISFVVAGGPQMRRTAETAWSCLDETIKVHHLLQLEAKGANELITNPVKGQLSYDERVIKFIQNLTNNQPYLIQMFCERIISLCNKRHVDYVDGVLVTSAVDSILDRGASHFKWMWDHLRPQEQQVLSALAWAQKAEEESVTLRDIILLYQSNGLSPKRDLLRQTLDRLEEQNHIVMVNNSTAASYRWKIAADLMREWLQRTKPFKKNVRGRHT